MTNADVVPFKPKKSVALSGVTAGNTALCTVGKTGNDLHYRGYDILDIATQCEFEEIAYLLVHEKLPNKAELAAYKAKLKSLRAPPAAVLNVLEELPAASHPMDVLRTGVSALGCLAPEANDHSIEGARDIADRLLASLGSMLCYWHHYANGKRRIDMQTDDDSIGAHFLHLLHGRKPPAEWVRAMHTSLNLYAEHEFNASTFTARVIAGTGSDLYSCIAGAIGALRGPKHGGANEVAFEIQSRYASVAEAEADIRKRVANKEVIIGSVSYTHLDLGGRIEHDDRHLAAAAARGRGLLSRDQGSAAARSGHRLFEPLGSQRDGHRARIGFLRAQRVPSGISQMDGRIAGGIPPRLARCV